MWCGQPQCAFGRPRPHSTPTPTPTPTPLPRQVAKSGRGSTLPGARSSSPRPCCSRSLARRSLCTRTCRRSSTARARALTAPPGVAADTGRAATTASRLRRRNLPRSDPPPTPKAHDQERHDPYAQNVRKKPSTSCRPGERFRDPLGMTQNTSVFSEFPSSGKTKTFKPFKPRARARSAGSGRASS